MFSFFYKKRKPAVDAAFTPSEAELIDAMTNGAKTPEMKHYLEQRHARQQAERQVRAAERQVQLAERERAVRIHQKPGELWLHTPTGPKRALAWHGRQQGVKNNNKLVLGPAGSGRKLMLARLARAAQEAGNYVVILNNYGTNHNNPGALWMLTHSLGGTFIELATPRQIQFNPFWLPGAPGEAWRLPNLEEMSALSTVLVKLLRMTRYDAPVNEEMVEQWMYRALAEYFTSRELRASNEPSFASFAAQVATLTRDRAEEGIAPEFLDWFALVSKPFVPGGALEGLLSAKNHDVRQLVHCTRGLLHIELTLDERAVTEADTLDYRPDQWAPPQAQARALMLLLHTLDTHLGQRERRLTIVGDELNFDCLGGQVASYLDSYLSRWQHFNRELVVGWHAAPTSLFSDYYPAAQTILAHSSTQLLLANMLLSGGDLTSYAPLNLSEEEGIALVGLSREEWGVLLRNDAGHHEVFSAALARADLGDFIPERFLKRRFVEAI